MNASKTTPLMQQYLTIKEQYKDAVLFYRMGDFYEMFFEDAQLASRVLDITLTSRNKNESTPVPMCGVPYRAVQTYVARMIENGFKVALCDQVEDPAEAKGLVRREVVRVITPGMIFENEMLAAKDNNFLMALAYDFKSAGISCLDISTGTFKVTETSDSVKVLDEMQRIGPREVLLPSSLRDDPFFQRVESVLPLKSTNWLDDAVFDPQRARKKLAEQFGTLTLDGFGCRHLKTGVAAAGALLHYVRETQKQAVVHLTKIEVYSLDEHLIIDLQSRQNLELETSLRNGGAKGTLIDVLDKTVTPMGGRCLKNWLRYPLLSIGKIGERLDAVEEALARSDVRSQAFEALKSIYDLERLNTRIVMGHANGRDLVALKRSLQKLPVLQEALGPLQSDLLQWRLPLQGLAALADLIEAAIREDAPPTIAEGGLIKTGYNADLDELIQISRDGKGFLARMETAERQATGIVSLKVRYNRVFGYYIEIPKSQTKLAPPHYVRKQTLVNAERYITDELKQFEIKVLGAEEQRCQLELTLFHQLREKVRDHGDAIKAAADLVAQLDCLLAMAETADQNDYRRPRINTRGVIEIKEGRHPVVEKLISGERFVPNSIMLDNDAQQVLIITGPNMAGKSTVLRQVALNVILAQIGSFVPAAEADIAICDRIFTRVGALDNLAAGQSTFMVEMEETAGILNNATDRSLIIMDEIGRGTSTYDGLSIAWAVAEYLHDFKETGVKTLFATHYHELTELARTKPRVKNFTIAVKEWDEQILFLRKLVPGGTNRSYGIQVARLAGIPAIVIERAKEVLALIENRSSSGTEGSGLPTARGKYRRPIQLALFRPWEQDVLDGLRAVDLNRTTPMDAFRILEQLQSKMK